MLVFRFLNMVFGSWIQDPPFGEFWILDPNGVFTWILGRLHGALLGWPCTRVHLDMCVSGALDWWSLAVSERCFSSMGFVSAGFSSAASAEVVRLGPKMTLTGRQVDSSTWGGGPLGQIHFSSGCGFVSPATGVVIQRRGGQIGCHPHECHRVIGQEVLS